MSRQIELFMPDGAPTSCIELALLKGVSRTTIQNRWHKTHDIELVLDDDYWNHRQHYCTVSTVKLFPYKGQMLKRKKLANELGVSISLINCWTKVLDSGDEIAERIAAGEAAPRYATKKEFAEQNTVGPPDWSSIGTKKDYRKRYQILEPEITDQSYCRRK